MLRAAGDVAEEPAGRQHGEVWLVGVAAGVPVWRLRGELWLFGVPQPFDT